MNNIGVLQALVFEPRKAFAELDARPRFLWPLLILTLISTAVSFWYLSFVDLEWMMDRETRSSPLAENMTDAEIERRVAAAIERPGVQITLRTLAAFVAVPFGLLFGALYYVLASKITGVERSFRHWLALGAWTSMPTVLALLASAIMLATATSAQVGQEALQPLSLNALIFRRGADDPGYTLFASLNLLQFVSLWLAALGVKVWSGRSWLFSIIFTALPLLLIYGIWAFFALRQA